ncbi:MAG: CHAD domain-containing protein [Burkholderiales bacterium]|nr:CHAD domain-containing protein [Burkholderiales bacterium]
MEIELKLLVAPCDLARVAAHPAVAALHAGDAHEESLVSVYYDTPARDLARAGVALRVRRINGGWVQTVKGGGGSAAGLHQRAEHEWPLADERPDAALAEGTPLAQLFASQAVRERLAPVFVTEFVRTARPIAWPDGSSAELALDHGEVRAGDRAELISEVEIELRSGEPARLFELARAVLADVPLRVGFRSKAERGYALAGIGRRAPRKQQPVDLEPGMSAAAALQRIALACLAQVQANEAGFLAAGRPGRRDPEYLHQLRVGLRRLRSCYSLIRKLVPPERLGDRAEELRWLGQALNPARDWDVFMTESLPPIARRFAGMEGLPSLRRRGARLRRMHNARAREAVASPRYTALVLALGAAFARPDLAPLADGVPELAAPADAFARAVLDARHRKLSRRAPGIDRATPAERHAARIAAKRLRYAAEFFAPLHPGKRTRRYIGALEKIQDILGAVNDAAVTERLLVEAAGAGRTPIDPHLLGIVRGWLAAGAERELARFGAVWEAFAGRKKFWK